MEDDLIGQLDNILRSSGTRTRSTRCSTTTTSRSNPENLPPADWKQWRDRVKAVLQSSALKGTVRVVYGEPHTTEKLRGKWSAFLGGEVYRPTRRRNSSRENEDGHQVKPESVPLGVWRLLLEKAEANKAVVDNLINGTISTYPERALAAGMGGKSGMDLLMNMVRDEELAIAYQVRKMVGCISKDTGITISYTCTGNTLVQVSLSRKEVAATIGDRYRRTPSSMESLQLLCALISKLDAIGKQTINAIAAIRFSPKGGDTTDNDNVAAISGSEEC